ncbi:hypothetical protein [Aquincola sp. J276]|uniref:hypothetical protein n=1 Tax=Aquincola sp. J276 TaxID=2898432 RepID=UPI0021512CAD|nr:hypothetical protein [Aquincola sp. J276]MCR5863852.1 hypothetical protein [Aquincola sp. J276]
MQTAPDPHLERIRYKPQLNAARVVADMGESMHSRAGHDPVRRGVHDPADPGRQQ